MLWSRWRHWLRLFIRINQRSTFPFINTMLVGLAGLALLLATYIPMQAAVELSFYNVLVLPTGVVLEWQTASEYDLIGFEVWYKEESASQSSYTLLGKRIAQGSPQHGVTYRMDVTALLEAKTTYCFQLRELPINGERGEILNRCGYGLGISAQPTPTPTPLFTPTSAFTPTTILTSTIPLTASQPVSDPFAIPTTDPFATPFVDPFAIPTTDPFATPFVDPFATPTTDPNQAGGGFPTETPTPIGQSLLPTPFPGALGDGTFPTPTAPFVTTPVTSAVNTMDANALTAPVDPFAQAAAMTNTTMTDAPAVFDSALPTPTPSVVAGANPPYIVLTATPTTPATIVPTFTPYPTGVPQVNNNLLGLRVPDTQNLMIMLLCGVFSGASGLGILGLVSTLLYMRSRAQARQDRTSQRTL